MWIVDPKNKKGYANKMTADEWGAPHTNFPLAMDNANSTGIRSDGETEENRRVINKEFNNLSANSLAADGIWSDETTMWVVDTKNTFPISNSAPERRIKKIAAYILIHKTRSDSNDITPSHLNDNPHDILANGATM